MTVFSPQNEMSIFQLLYPNAPPTQHWSDDLDEPKEWDTFDQFKGHDKQSAQLKR